MDAKQWKERRQALPLEGLTEEERASHETALLLETTLLHIETAGDTELGIQTLTDSRLRQLARLHMQAWKVGELLFELHKQLDMLGKRPEIKTFVAGNDNIHPELKTPVAHYLHVSREMMLATRNLTALNSMISEVEQETSGDKDKVRKYYDKLAGVMSSHADLTNLNSASSQRSGAEGDAKKGETRWEKKKRERRSGTSGD